MDPIRQVFAYRLREKRGARTQESFSALLGIPLRTYQKMEAGNVPQKKSLQVLVERLGLESETALFADPELGSSKLRLFQRVSALDESEAKEFLALLDDLDSAQKASPSPSSDGLKSHPVAKNPRKS